MNGQRGRCCLPHAAGRNELTFSEFVRTGEPGSTLPHRPLVNVWCSGRPCNTRKVQVSVQLNETKPENTTSDFFPDNFQMVPHTSQRASHMFCRAKPKGGNCLLFKQTVTAFWLCRGVFRPWGSASVTFTFTLDLWLSSVTEGVFTWSGYTVGRPADYGSLWVGLEFLQEGYTPGMWCGGSRRAQTTPSHPSLSANL